MLVVSFFFSSRRRHTRCYRDWSSDVCSSDLDSTGEYWLTPDQVRLLKEMRQVAAHLHASNQLLPDPRLVRKSRATSKVRAAAPSHVDSSTVAAFTELTRRSWLPV